MPDECPATQLLIDTQQQQQQQQEQHPPPFPPPLPPSQSLRHYFLDAPPSERFAFLSLLFDSARRRFITTPYADDNAYSVDLRKYLTKRPRSPRSCSEQRQQRSSLHKRLLEAPLSDQVGFLIWLFDEALHRQLPPSPDPSANAHGARSAADHTASRRRRRPPRKHRRRAKRNLEGNEEEWAPDEIDFLVELMVEARLPVGEATEEFLQRYSHRSERNVKSFIYSWLIGPDGRARRPCWCG